MTTTPVSGNQSFTSVHNIPGQIPELNVPVVNASQVTATLFGSGNPSDLYDPGNPDPSLPPGTTIVSGNPIFMGHCCSNDPQYTAPNGPQVTIFRDPPEDVGAGENGGNVLIGFSELDSDGVPLTSKIGFYVDVENGKEPIKQQVLNLASLDLLTDIAKLLINLGLARESP